MSSPTTHLTRDDIDFLARPLYGILSTAAGPQPPQPRPVWFEATDDDAVQIFTGPETLKVRRLRRDPRASLLVASPVGERERWVCVAGHVTLQTDGAHQLVSRLFARYWGPEASNRADELAGMLDADWIRVLLRPEKVSRFIN
jgi:PPOX class probable F420-dependent enzyme